MSLFSSSTRNLSYRFRCFPRQLNRINSTANRSRTASATTNILSKVPGPEKVLAMRAPFSPDFDLKGKVIIVTGGGRGLGLTMAEALVDAGCKVHCLDRLPEADADFKAIQEQACPGSGGSLHYDHVDVSDEEHVKDVIASIASDNNGIHGLIAAAGIQQITPAVEYSVADVRKMLDINYTGLFTTATAVAIQMMKYACHGSVLLVGSMSGFIANKGLISPVYNSSKAAVIQLGRNLAMEWGKQGIRVNTLCPGHIVTPMVKKNFEDEPHLKKIWEDENMLGRLARPEEFRGAGIFLLSDASSFMTGGTLTIDGGHTAW